MVLSISCTVSNKKTHLAGFETCVFRVYLRNIYLHPCLQSFQIKKNFSNPVSKSAEINKKIVLPEKSKLLEKIHHFEKIQNFFHRSMV